MKYRLINTELEKVLNRLTYNYKFSDQLQEAIKNRPRNSDVIEVNFGLMLFKNGNEMIPIYTARFYETEIEPYEEDWNNFPEVTPPIGKVMRLQFENKFHQTQYYSAWFTAEGKWRDYVGNAVINLRGCTKIKFKPWDD